jgi:hypothetical protein
VLDSTANLDEGDLDMTRILTAAALLAACASLALGAAAASAADKPSLVDQVAARLGVTPEQLRAAFRATLTARVDAAVAAGKLTPEQAARLKQRIADARGIGLGPRHAFAKHRKALVQRIGARGRGLGLAAAYLGLTREQLRMELRSGKSLSQIATAKGKTSSGLVAAILAPAKERLAKAVSARRLTQQRADEILKRLTERVTRAVQRARPATP